MDWEVLRQMENIRLNLQHRYTVTVNQVIVPTETRSDDLNITNRYHWIRGFFVSDKPWSRKSWKQPQSMEYRMNYEINHAVERGYQWKGYLVYKQ